ncbi:MAG: MmgE/PrpD family protein [Actinomycetota bacterium]
MSERSTSGQPPNSDELAAALWASYGRLTVDDLPPEAVEVARHCILDWLGCTVAGSTEPLAGLLRDELGEVPGPATVIGTSSTTGMLQAAMINGATGHALDFDDTHTGMGGHPSVPVLPALLALAETTGASGAEVVAAFVTGMEIQCRLGDAIGGGHYARGWHKTSTIGVFGAAAACARLLGLDEEAFGNALGLAASNAAGLKANFGTMTKPYHAGHAAERGLLAARLASRGYTADHRAVGGRQGLAEAAGDGALRPDRLVGLGERWLIRDTLFKFHAACYLTHAGIEATRAVVVERSLAPEDIESVTVEVHPSLLDVCNIQHPTTGLEAKFSLRATQAFAVHGVDTARVDTFEDGPINEPAIQKLLDRVTVTTDPALTTTATRVAVATTDGAVSGRFHDAGVPAADLDAQWEALAAKFGALAGPVLGEEAAARAVIAVRGVEQLPEVRVGSMLGGQ